MTITDALDLLLGAVGVLAALGLAALGADRALRWLDRRLSGPRLVFPRRSAVQPTHVRLVARRPFDWATDDDWPRRWVR